ncbi:FAD dependent oxidoreductase [Melanomma pulvis-pyrius CBS 109.77]|uniref:FAD dependent oxidoreductase n=1 Tax=Melanomma pulvis-pyrius CBS 109.77 TaxID=1314802 RepID=A0A6A6XTQ5_9PLEO|nr:FAD dependent oxidoreductase [Melanomma pulvis-pyrius CBS 109.77]
MEIPISELVLADPGLPVPNPTNPYWLQPPHSLSRTQSATLPSTTDVVIIGSGITASSASRTLLENHPTYHITVLEARTLCSGATGRNGGHLVAYGGLVYSDLKKNFGEEQARQTVKFTFDNIERTKELIAKYGKDAEYRDVTRVRGFEDNATFESAKKSIAEFEEDNSDMAGMYRIITKEVAAKMYGVNSIVGAVLFAAGALWPYRLITNIFEHLSEKYDSRLSLETSTPALEIIHDQSASSHPYLVQTPRGAIRASHVVHCTNGHSGCLLPKIRGALFPMRGSMTVQDLEGRVPNRGDHMSWSLHHAPKFDPSTGLTQIGTFYLQQNHHSRLFFFGGERKNATETLTADDSVESNTSVEGLQEKLSTLFGLDPGVLSRVVSSWSGIMGFTSDGLPLVGKLDESVTGRAGRSEWIAAGFNGMGMSMCVLAGERLAKKILGQEDVGIIPGAFEVTKERLETSLKSEISVANMEAIFSSTIGREARAK